MNGQEDKTQGGAIIFITDGKQDCNGGLDIDDQSVIDRIKKTKVRIITVAFGWVAQLTMAYLLLTHKWEYIIFHFQLFFCRKDSDSRLENLAAISGGKTYFVKDGMFTYENSLYINIWTIIYFCSNISGSGLEDINGVFEESNTYQPAVPSNEAEIIVSNIYV